MKICLLRRAVLLFATALWAWPAGAQSLNGALSAVTVSDIDEQPVKLAAFAGKPLLINFWARWCAPCRKEIPDLVAVDAKYRGQGLVILGLAVEESQYHTAVRDFAAKYAVTYPVLLTGTSKGIDLMNALGNDKGALPFTVVIDRAGKPVARKLGAMSKAEMEAAIETALK